MTRIPKVRYATPDDFDSVLEIRNQLMEDLLQRGFNWDTKALTRHHLNDWMSAGALFVGEFDDRVIGAVAVWRYDILGSWPPGDPAGYVRDLMIDPAFRHQGLGVQLLSWAERFIVGLGRSLVRLDCDSSNVRLCRYYEEAGYGRVGDDPDGWALFEKRL